MFKWVPCDGPPTEAIERMRAHFEKPSELMGEAWFMGVERRLYAELSETPVDEHDLLYLGRCLFEITSGTTSFGRRGEWEKWFRYLLPGLVLRGRERHAFETLLEPTITAFMVLFPKSLEGEYAGFREDALASLGACVMRPEAWDDCGGEARAGGAHPRGRFLTWEDEEGFVELSGWDAGRACEPLSASLFFCLKYLNEGEVGAWAESVFAVRDPYFRASLAVWLLGALDLLEAAQALPRAIEKSEPRVNWRNSFLLESAYQRQEVGGARDPVNDVRDFLPRANRAAFVRAVRRLLTTEALLAWADSFSKDELLYENFYRVPDLLFERLSE